jgi:hypothetical protein
VPAQVADVEATLPGQDALGHVAGIDIWPSLDAAATPAE